MKNLVLWSALVLGLSSCAKDSLDDGSADFRSIDKSEIFVKVSYLSWDDTECEPGCVLTVKQIITNIANVEVRVYAGEHSNSDDVSPPDHLALTDQDGSALITSLDPGQYTLIVVTPYGEKSRTIYTQLNRRSSIDFSF